MKIKGKLENILRRQYGVFLFLLQKGIFDLSLNFLAIFLNT